MNLYLSILSIEIIKKFLKKFLKILGIILASILVLVFILILFIRSPWGQGIIVDKAIAYLEDKTGADVGIGRLFITFSGNVSLEEFYLSDVNGDTLVYSQDLEAGLAFVPLIKDGAYHISKFDWEGLKVRVSRPDSTGKFNFDYLLEAFATPTVDSVDTNPPLEESSPLNISLSPISLQNFDILYKDEVMGINASLILGDLELSIPVLDLDNSTFGIKSVEITDTKIAYTQSKPFPVSEETEEETPLPIVHLEELSLKNISLDYDNQVDNQLAKVQIGDLELAIPEIDLPNQKVDITEVTLAESSILFHDFSSPDTLSTDPTIESQSSEFTWPDWDVQLKKLSLSNNQLEYKTKDETIKPGAFNTEVIQLKNLSVLAEDVSLAEETASLNVTKFSFQEGSGFELKDLLLDLKINNKKTEISKFYIATNRSELDSKALLSYQSIQQLIDAPDQTSLSLEIPDFSLDVRDSYFFDPSLSQDSIIQIIAKSPLEGDLNLNGDLSEIDITDLKLSWDNTAFSTKGTVSHFLTMDSLYFDLPQISLKTDKSTLVHFINESDYGVQFPDKINLDASAKGKLDDLMANMDLNTNLGTIQLEANYLNRDQIAFDLDLQLNEIQLGTLLNNPDFKDLTLGLQAHGSGPSLNTLDASIESNFEQLGLYGSDFSGLKLSGEITDGKGGLNMNLNSEYLDFDLTSTIELDSVNSKIGLNLDLEGIDFYELGFASKETRAKLKLEGNFEGNLTDFTASLSLHDGLVLYDENTYPTGNLELHALVGKDTTSVTVDSKIVKGFVQTNTNTNSLIAGLENHLMQYFSNQDTTFAILDSGIVMNMDLSIYDTPIVNDFLFKGLEQLDSARVQLAFYQEFDSLSADISFPYINYSGTEIDSLEIKLLSNLEDMNLDFGFQNLTSGPLIMEKTSLTGELKDSRIFFEFENFADDEQFFHVSSDIGLVGDSVSIHINPEDLILKKSNWNIPETNQVLYTQNNLDFQDFTVSQEGQELSIKKNIEGFTDENLAVIFQNFRLSTITSLLNPEEIIAGGKLDGQLVIENPFGAMGLMGELNIDSLKTIGVPLGNLALKATAKSLGNYILDLQLRDFGIDLDLDGSFIAKETGGEFDIKLDLLKAEMTKIAELSKDQILDASGYLTGTVNANGTTTDPRYEGEFQFHETSFVPAQLSTKYLLSDEDIKADNEGVYFNQFTIRDADNNTFTIDGKVLTPTFTNPEFDLKLTAKNFMVVNSTDEENDLFYGKGTIDADVTINGDLILPVVRAKLNVKSNTDLSLIVPESQLDLVERDGVVLFVNKEDPDDILTSQIEETTTAFSGYDIQAQLTTDPKAKFTVIIDPKTGDNLLVSGTGNLQMDINPNGRMTLTGDYEITDGHYEMSLYNLISKKFIINPGSRIAWNGDPMDAVMEIRAIYEVDASASALMSSQLTGSSQTTQSQYQRRLPFLVYLNVAGELLKPEISFALDMPEDERGAFGGNVYSQVLQLNDQEDELNKQVFSLLVLNRFFPSSGSDGSNGGAEAIARNSASQILSDQMNALSSNLFGADSGFQLGFDVDTYQDYQSGSAQNRTDLNINAQQSLFNDRLIVEVGSQVGLEGNSQSEEQSNSILANVSFEYLLTEDGRWRIRAFRKNQFESIIDGQLVVTGGGLIFNREFNEFSELWKKPVENPDETSESNDQEKKQEDHEN